MILGKILAGHYKKDAEDGRQRAFYTLAIY